jgi:hypothetical protein
MNLDVVKSELLLGSVFSIETKKEIEMAEGAPSRVMLKVSRYTVTTDLGRKPEPASWWNYTNTNSIVVKKGRDPKLYLLCAMYKGAGFGESGFFAQDEATGRFDESKAYTKYAVEKYMPPKEPFTADHMTLPLDSIRSLVVYEAQPVELSDAQKPWTCPDKPCVVQVRKPSPWADLPPRAPTKKPEWDPEFAPTEF